MKNNKKPVKNDKKQAVKRQSNEREDLEVKKLELKVEKQNKLKVENAILPSSNKKSNLKKFKELAVANAISIGKLAVEHEEEIFNILLTNIRDNEKWAIDIFYRHINPYKNATKNLIDFDEKEILTSCNSIDSLIKMLVDKLLENKPLSEEKVTSLIQLLNSLKLADNQVKEDGFFASLPADKQRLIASWRLQAGTIDVTNDKDIEVF